MKAGFVTSYFTAACGLMLVAALQPVANEPVVVLSAPWATSAPAVVAQAGGRILSTGLGDRVAITQGEGRPRITNLYASGAIAVISARVWQACAGLLPASKLQEVAQ